MHKPEHPIQCLLTKEGSSLASLIAKANQFNLLKTNVTTCLPVDLAPYLTGIHMEEGRLCLLTHSPAWATRFRFAAPALLERLRKDPKLGLITKIQVQVVPDLMPQSTTAAETLNATPPKNGKKETLELSSETAQQLLSLASEIENQVPNSHFKKGITPEIAQVHKEEGKKLVAALEKLAKHRK